MDHDCSPALQMIKREYTQIKKKHLKEKKHKDPDSLPGGAKSAPKTQHKIFQLSMGGGLRTAATGNFNRKEEGLGKELHLSG